MRPQEVLDYKADIAERFKLGWLGDLMSATLEKSGFEKTDFCGVSLSHLSVAECYYVAGGMNPLLAKVADDIPEDLLANQIIAPSRCGFIIYENAIEILEIHGWTERISALIWGPCSTAQGTATLVTVWNDFKRHPDHFIENFRENLADSNVTPSDYKNMMNLLTNIGCWSPMTPVLLYPDRPIGPTEYAVPQSYKDALMKMDNNINEAELRETITSLDRIVLATWFIMGETVTDVSEAQIQRHFAKRAVRRGIPPRVTVITLRRKSKKSDSQTVVEWRHSWPVREHTRKQRYGPNNSLVKEVRIGPYIKDPGRGKPLIQTEKVYHLKR